MLEFGRFERTHQWHVVEHIEPAALRGDDHLVVTLLEGDVCHRHRRQIELEGKPFFAVIVRDVEMRFGSSKDQAFLVWIGADSAREVVIGNAVNDFLPGLAVVARLPQEGMEVIGEIHGGGHVGCTGVEGRSCDAVDAYPLRQIFGGDVLPVFAVILVVTWTRPSSEPTQITPGFDRRLIDRKDRVVVFDSGVVFGDGATRGTLFGFVIAGEVGAHLGPVLAFIGRGEQDIGAGVKPVGLFGENSRGKLHWKRYFMASTPEPMGLSGHALMSRSEPVRCRTGE